MGFIFFNKTRMTYMFKWLHLAPKRNMVDFSSGKLRQPLIYTIICLKSVNVRKVQVAILARLPREMSQTDRILPRYILSRVRASFRPRIFLYAKKPQTRVTRSPTVQRHGPSERRNNLKGLHARWRLTSQFLA